MSLAALALPSTPAQTLGWPGMLLRPLPGTEAGVQAKVLLPGTCSSLLCSAPYLQRHPEQSKAVPSFLVVSRHFPPV